MENKVSIGLREVLFKEGNQADKLFLIKRGEILCLKSSNDRLIPVFLAKEGDIVGESAMVLDVAYTYSAISLTTSELIEIPASDFKTVMGLGPKWLSDLTVTMISRFQSTSNLIAENRLVHNSIISEEDFTPSLEVEFKKLLA